MHIRRSDILRGVVYDCPGSVVVVKTLAQPAVTLQAYTGTYFAAYKDFPRMSFQAMNGRLVCARFAYRPGIIQCGSSFSVDADGTTGLDQFELSCDKLLRAFSMDRGRQQDGVEVQW
jgi:hypothetical protein